jgi:hypothetical protein
MRVGVLSYLLFVWLEWYKKLKLAYATCWVLIEIKNKMSSKKILTWMNLMTKKPDTFVNYNLNQI